MSGFRRWVSALLHLGTVSAEPPKPDLRKPLKISESALAASRRGSAVSFDHALAFQVAKPAPGVVPASHGMAMDDCLNSSISWASSSITNLAFNQGYTFLGYPYLAELAQIPEYRLISEVIATEATRKWIEIQSASDKANKAKDKADKLKELDAELERLGARPAFKELSEHDGFFGRAHLYLDTGDTDDRPELLTPLGDGDKVTQRKLKKGDLRALKTVEPVWCYPARYNANDPLKDEWYRPNTWFVMGKEVHSTRLLTFVAREVPDLLKPAFSFGGLSLSQMAKPYVDNWLQTRQSVNDLIQAFSQMILKTDLSTVLQGGASESLFARVDMFNNSRNNRGTMVVNKESEDVANVSVPLGTLDKLQAQAQEHMASVSRIPLIKLLGITPSGLNASSDGEIRAFYDTIHAYQESFFDEHLTTVFKLAQINLWGQVDDDLSYIWLPLWELDEKALAELRKVEAETAQIDIDAGALSPEERRQAIADEPDSPYASIEVDDEPAPSPKDMEALGKAAAQFGKAGGEEDGEEEPDEDQQAA